MSPLPSPALTRHKLRVDFGTLKHACPKGIYVAPVPEHPLRWTGVMFIRKGPYANAILRFQIEFPDDFPQRPPVVAFQSDLFHPLVTPLTTYTYSTRDFGTDTQSAVDEQRLPPGGLSLRHGFPEWFDHDSKEAVVPPETEISDVDSNVSHEGNVHQGPGGNVVGGTPTPHERSPHVVELLQYMRIVFDTDEVLDMIPVEAAANTGAWHAWQSHRSKSTSRAASTARQANGAQRSSTERSMSPRQQPGGARRPGEWNWQGVWEDRVRRSIQNSLSEPVLFGADNDVISFLKMDVDSISQISPLQQTETAG